MANLIRNLRKKRPNVTVDRHDDGTTRAVITDHWDGRRDVNVHPKAVEALGQTQDSNKE